MKNYEMPIVAFVAAVCSSMASSQEVVAKRAVDDVQWPSNYEGASAPTPDGPFRSVNQSYLPVLVPERFLSFNSLSFVGEPLSYTVSVAGRGYKATITGTRVSFDADTSSKPQKSTSLKISSGEQEAMAAFSKYGVGYIIIVECEAAGDPRCEGKDYVSALASETMLVGGTKGNPDNMNGELGAGAPLPPGQPADPNFKFMPAGQLLPGSGNGVQSQVIFAPGIRFPVERPKAYLNSQVWGIGGSQGQKGGWSDPRNYQYPWRDNFCESRSRKTPACPSGSGHQGVDIRANGPQDRTHWSVATESGRISNIGTYSVTLMGDSGTQYRYLHLEMAKLSVKPGDRVERGQRIGLISNDFGKTPTTVHLHFEILQNSNGLGFRHVPPYSSLVKAYQSFG